MVGSVATSLTPAGVARTLLRTPPGIGAEVFPLTPDRRTLLALFSFAFGLRILYAVVLGTNPEIVPVQETYEFRIAAQMAQSMDWLTRPFSPVAPGYLVLLSIAFRIAGASWWTAVLLNAVLGAATTLFLYRIGEKQIGRRVGFFSALWLGAMFTQLHYASLAVREVFTTFLLVWLVYALAKPFHRMRYAIWTGVLFVMLVYTDPIFVLLLPVLLLFLGLRATHHRVLSAQYLILFITTVIVVSVPWTVRNYVVHRDFVPISIKATRYTAPFTRWLREVPPQPEVPQAVRLDTGFLRHEVEFWRIARLADSPGDPARGIGPEPAWSLRHNLASLLSYGLLLPFFVTGLLLALRQRQRTVLIVGGTVVAYALLRGFISGGDHARLAVEPLIILVAFYAVRQLLLVRRAEGELRADQE